MKKYAQFLIFAVGALCLACASVTKSDRAPASRTKPFIKKACAEYLES